MTALPIVKPVYGIVGVPGGWGVVRDHSGMKTPAGNDLVVPTASLAEALAEEWRGQGVKPNPKKMPLTQLAATAIDLTRKNREAAIDQLTVYATSDLLCHRADDPPELHEWQNTCWQPLLDWVEQKFSAPLNTGSGIMPVEQSPESVTALRQAIAFYDDFRLTGLQQAVDVSGSLILGLALIMGHMNADEVFVATELEQLFQIGKWGSDPAVENRHQSIKQELATCVKWFEFLR